MKCLSQLGQPDLSETQEEVNDKAEDDDQNDPIPTITSYKEAITALKDAQNLLENHGHLSTSITHIGPAVDAITSLKVGSMSQWSLHDQDIMHYVL